MFPQLSPPSAQGATYRRLYRGQCRGCGELVLSRTRAWRRQDHPSGPHRRTSRRSRFLRASRPEPGTPAFSHRRMSLKTGVGAFCVAGAPFWFFGFDLGTGESSSGLWDCGNRGAISKGGGKRRETWFWFSSFSIARHFHSPLPAVQHGVFAERKLANSFCLARCIRRAAAVSLSAWAMRPRASSLCPGLR